MTEQIIKIDLDMTERELLEEFSKRSEALKNEINTSYVRDEIMNSDEPNLKRIYEAIRKLEHDVWRCQSFLGEICVVIDTYHRENDIGSRGNVQ